MSALPQFSPPITKEEFKRYTTLISKAKETNRYDFELPGWYSPFETEIGIPSSRSKPILFKKASLKRYVFNYN